MANRRTGIGFDQLVLLTPDDGGADVHMRIWNADGSEVAACGNATRCVVRLLTDESDKQDVTIRTAAGLLTGSIDSDHGYSVNMGPANLEAADIPLSKALDTLTLPISEGPLSNPAAVNMGNPHMVFFVENSAAIDLPSLGPDLEHHPLFPERANVSIAEVINRHHLHLKVWERGAGITLACGTAACASVVAAARRGLTDRAVRVTLDGGDLFIDWLADGTVLMTGPATLSYRGQVTL